MYHTVRIYVSDGVQLEYAIPSSYIKQEYIRAYSQAPDEAGYYTDEVEPLEFEWLNDGVIKLKRPVPQGHRITIRRETYADEPLVDFQDAAILVENDLNGSALQALHVAQEARERNDVSSTDTSERVSAALDTISDTVRETTAIAEKAVEAAEKAAQAVKEAVEIIDPEGRFEAINQRFESTDEAIDEKADSDDLKAMAYAEDAPADDRLYIRKASSWEVYEEPDLAPFPWLIGQAIQYLGPLPDASLLEPYYLVADGSEVSREDYPELFAAYGTTYGGGDGTTTFNIPDLRGVFLRGLGGQSAALGVKQGDAQQPIVGKLSYNTTTAMVYDSLPDLTGPFKVGAAKSNRVSSIAGAGKDVEFDSSLVVRTASENRPTNMAVNYFIFAKSPTIASSSDFTAAINAVNAGLAGRLETSVYDADRATDAPMRAKAIANVNADGSLAAAKGIVACTRTATGVYVVTFESGLFKDANKMIHFAQIKRPDNYGAMTTTRPTEISITQVTIRLYGTDGSTGLNQTFNLVVYEL